MARDPHTPAGDDTPRDETPREGAPRDEAERPDAPEPAVTPDPDADPASAALPEDADPGAGAVAPLVPQVGHDGDLEPAPAGGAPDASDDQDRATADLHAETATDPDDGPDPDGRAETVAPDGGRDDAPDDGPGTEVPATPPAPSAEPPATTGAVGAVGRHGTPAQSEPRGFGGLGRALRPRASRSQIVVGVLCALLGFALVVQVSQTQEDQLSSLRQSDLVRLLDDVTQRSGELEDQVSSLEATRDELRSGTGRERAALEVAEQQAETLGVLSGRLPAQGPGIEIEVVEGGEPLDAFGLFNVLEELRNAGAEAMEVNGVRLVASSYFEDTSDGIVVDGQPIASPYRWAVIGDPSTLETALEIPGGAMASLRGDGARTAIQQHDVVEVTATVEPGTPQYATPVPADG